MIAVAGGLALLNIATLIALARGREVANWELFVALLIDFVGADRATLYERRRDQSVRADRPVAGRDRRGAARAVVELGAGRVAQRGVRPARLCTTANSPCRKGLRARCRRRICSPAGSISCSPRCCWCSSSRASTAICARATRSLAEMRQRAAEEDHIVRMGLLASGAAHELGTPLSSLSVILGDWRKQPALATDPALSEEIGEMQAAVAALQGDRQRHPLRLGRGAQRGSRTHHAARVPAVGRRTSGARSGPGCCTSPIGSAAPPRSRRIARSRRSLTNVLDNAAEAGATRVDLIADCNDGALILTVRDDGRGFPRRDARRRRQAVSVEQGPAWRAGSACSWPST